MVKVIFRTPSWPRFLKILKMTKDISLLRCLEYERFACLGLTGKILDFGGGRKARYFDLIRNWGDPIKGFKYESANIDPKMEPTYLVEERGRVPVEDGIFDAVISLNTLEHVSSLSNVVAEMNRILKPEGSFIFTAPFIFRVHGHPDDFLRGTPSFWERLLESQGFEKIEIEAMNWGPFSTASTITGTPGPFKGLRLRAAMALDLVYFALRHGHGMRLIEKQDSPICNAPLAYFVWARKKFALI